ncbi:MAG: D-aminopeptidase [Acidimicrobiales bacterium]|nr:MAG: class A beta-lactamase-related serine hydrolase [Actinomycetota bacterium]MBV6507400.1 D-aminopeptidase [Acidimicrobiales bacterium]RIK07787.1 MAG: hypothetical protein DCC48_02180 [Acidobacteriota bacterium]
MLRSALAALTVGAVLLGCSGGDTSAGSAAGDGDPPAPATETAEVFDFAGAGTPGCAIGVDEGGRVTYAKGFGEADLAAGTPISDSTLFDIASLSKQMTAAAILLLSDEGLVDLGADIHTYLPALPGYGMTVTVQNLIDHTSGLPEYIDGLTAEGFELEEVTTDEDALAWLAEQPELEFEPGTSFSYSDTGYFLLSQIVESVTGMTLANYAEEQIFEPLGMDDTFYRDNRATPVPGLALGYEEVEPGVWEVAMSEWEQVGDGAVNTNVTDLLRWSDALMGVVVTDNGIGSARWREQMFREGTLADGSPTGYAAGLIVEGEGDELIVAHDGSWLGYSSSLLVAPAQELAVVVLCNIDEAFTDGFASAVFDLWQGD